MALVYLAKATRAGAGWPHEQERSGALGVAFSPIRTATFFANGMDIALFDNALNLGQLASFANGAFEPPRQALRMP